jgi:hypothetical protein
MFNVNQEIGALTFFLHDFACLLHQLPFQTPRRSFTPVQPTSLNPTTVLELLPTHLGKSRA